jgi:Secretory lipase
MSSPSVMSRTARWQLRRWRARGAALTAGSALLLLVAGCGRDAPSGSAATGSRPQVFQPPGPFYQPPAPLPAGRPGQLIRDESLDAPPGYKAWRILFHSRDVAGRDIAVSGFAVMASGPAPAGGRPVLAYAHGIRGLARLCAPSNVTEPLAGLANFAPLLKRGAVVVATDYPGLGAPGPHPYLVGVSEARSVLDAVRAARQLAAVKAGHRVIVFGDTQGGQAALFTGQIAASYAPELRLLGVAAENPPTNLAAVEKHAAATPFAVESLLEAAAGYSAAYPSANLRAILTPRGRTDLSLLHSECDDQFGRATTGQAVSAAFSQDPLTTPPWSTGLAADSAGRTRTPAPILITQGTADQVYPAGITASFVRRICKLGDTVDYRTYPQTGHAVTIASAPDVLAWIGARLQGQPAPDTCP